MNENYFNNLSLTLKQLRVEKGLKQCELAKTLGITTSTLCKMESNSRKITLELLGRYCQVFSLSPSQILEMSIGVKDE